MKIKTLFAAILAAGLLFSGCRQDEDYVMPSLRVWSEPLEFGQQQTGQAVEIMATRDWVVRSKPDWVTVEPDHGPASSSMQQVTVSVLDNDDYDRTGEVLFSIGLAKGTVAVSQKGAKGAKSMGTGTLEDPYTFEGANAAAAALGTDVESATDVYIKGKISKIANNGTFTEGGSYGNASFYINDDGTPTEKDFYCYRILYLGNKKYTSGTDIKVGDEVIVCGKLMNYRGDTPETVANEAYLYSLNGVTNGGGGGGGQTTVSYSKVSSITSGGKYILIGIKDGKYYAATPIASDKTYGRLNGKETAVANDKISSDMSANEFTITAVSGGYEIAMPDGRKLAVDTEHDGTFQIGDNFDHTFTAELANGLFKISHKATGKTIYHGGGTYTNFSCSATVPSDGTLLQLYLKDNK